MLMRLPPTKRGLRYIFLSLCALSAFYLYLFTSSRHVDVENPLTLHIVSAGRNGQGGRWYIPPAWKKGQNGTGCATSQHHSISDAAECALSLALSNNAFIDNSRIPLIAHQTWRSMAPDTWSDVVRECIERWITFATGSAESDSTEMAWFLWDDEGVDAFVRKYESELYPHYALLPYPVEKSDVFRVLVLKWFGGVYGDIDSSPITHPHHWINSKDIANWTDTTGKKHALSTPAEPAFTVPHTAPATYRAHSGIGRAQRFRAKPSVEAIFGLEADNPPDPDTSYWRMGYSIPVQITNWAFAMSPHHPVANRYISDLVTTIEGNKTVLKGIDPLDITGPPALTRAVQQVVLRDDSEFDWQSLSGRTGDPVGGRSKVVAGDTLVLPITGFNPGRGRFHNMGSQPFSHPNARLRHNAAGSWRKKDFKVEYGKFCRTAFGMCRYWKKIPEA